MLIYKYRKVLYKMKKIIRYKCEICNEIYCTEGGAKDCENKAIENPLVELEQIVLFLNERNDYYVEKLIVREIKSIGHLLNYGLGNENISWANYHVLGNCKFKELCAIVKSTDEAIVSKPSFASSIMVSVVLLTTYVSSPVPP